MIGLRWILCLCIGVMLVIAGVSLLIFTPHTTVIIVGKNVDQGLSLQVSVTMGCSITVERANPPNATENSNSTVTNSTLP